MPQSARRTGNSPPPRSVLTFTTLSDAARLTEYVRCLLPEKTAPAAAASAGPEPTAARP